ncbi:RING finger protein 151 [Syngnathoides biaculeatus]|uniref:RING finger protein 151 n=1 Tax=Syngnathoides biaculeatus TaxID=300417 RepID=UPI002ADD6066|nr:RING finger protein 151 [Syngnathoides biaculeatus]XP_061676226.1 RING finger protein 151 [Syngnathoides biaculeatus]
MGYDLERFVGFVNEGLLCCVCRDVLQRPLQAPCEHAFCSACISGWLLHHRTCPEDRQPLDVGALKPLYRYMRNDLNRLQIRCVNAAQGCKAVCSLEGLHTHEDECDFAFVSCTNSGCPAQVERRALDAHLSECNFCSRECPNGCGHTLAAAAAAEQSQHNCVAELRAEVETLRVEMLCKVEEVRREMESRLDSQRRHMVQKESRLKNEVEEVKGQLSRITGDVRALLGAERLRRQELAEVELEKRELLELLRDPHPARSRGDRPTPEWELGCEPLRRQRREASLHLSSLSLHSTQALNGSGGPPSPQASEGARKSGTRSLTLDCIKKKSREVTII